MSRASTYYWKCDRASAFHGIREERSQEDLAALERTLLSELGERVWPKGVSLESISAQGNHLLWKACPADGSAAFLVRVEDGPERDGYQAVETRLLDLVRDAGVPTPRIAGADATRERVPFAWQAMEWIPDPNLQHWHARNELDLSLVLPEIGRAIARWQSLPVSGYGPFRVGNLVRDGTLRGHHERYPDYYRLQLQRHLDLLAGSGFLCSGEVARILDSVACHAPLLELAQGCLVHKDLAFWNILGSRDRIAAFIDFDDAIAGDPLDDLSLLACFHPPEAVVLAVEGYRSLRPLPEAWEARLVLHTLRNLVVKAVIRVGAGYFERDEQFFLIGSGSSGAAFRAETHRRLLDAVETLESLDREGSRDPGPYASLLTP